MHLSCGGHAVVGISRSLLFWERKIFPTFLSEDQCSMKPFETFLIPGEFALRFILKFLQIDVAIIDPALFVVFAGFLSWLIWMTIIRGIWAITLRIFGFEPRRY